jgi:hypothetical protein
MWESENQDESPLMTTDNFHGIDRLESLLKIIENKSAKLGADRHHPNSFMLDVQAAPKSEHSRSC